MSFLGVYRRSRFNEELGQSPGAESPAVNAPSDMRVDMSPSPEGPGKSHLRLPTENLASSVLREAALTIINFKIDIG